MRNKTEKILITGSSGTIGTRLFEKLLEQGYNVVGFDRKPNIWHKNLNNLTIKGDLLKKEDIEKIPENIDLIVHLAANARVYDLVLSPDLALENIVSVYNILNFSRKNKVKKFIFSSSREIYGNRKAITSGEKNVDLELCESPYAATKIGAEALVYSFSKCYGVDYVVLRLSNVYGAYDDSDRFVPLMIRKMKNNEDIVIYGADKFLDFTYIDDCVVGIIKSIKAFSKIKNNTINLASGKGEKLIRVAEIIKEKLDSKSKILIKNNRRGEVVRFIADISRARKLLGYKPNYSIQDGISLSVNWYNN